MGRLRRLVPQLAWVLPLALVGLCAAQEPAEPAPAPRPLAAAARESEGLPETLALADLLRLSLEQNPRLAQVALGIDAARGRALQAGLYPNPTLSGTFDELGDRTGPGGINTFPMVTQEIVSGGKLKLSRGAALREVDQAELALLSQRYVLFTAIRQSYFDALALQRRVEILDEVVKLAEQSVDASRKLLEAKLVARLNVVQLEVDLERFRVEHDAAVAALPATYRRLAAVVGVYQLPTKRLSGSLELPMPAYDLDAVQQFVVHEHPEVRSAQVGVERAQLLLQRARVEPIPNLTVGAGFVRQNQNASNDWSIGVSVPLPLWNRNQGNIQAAQAQVNEALQEVGRVENDLVDRLATAYREYAAARKRVARYQTVIIPKASETFDLSMKGYKGGEMEYLRVLEAQRSIGEAKLEYVRALGEAWKAASVIAGLALEDCWPPTIPEQAAPAK